MPSPKNKESKKIRTKRISLEKCEEFICHKVSFNLWLANLERKTQFEIEIIDTKFAEQILASQPISVIQSNNTKFQFFSAFEIINLAIAFPKTEMRLDVHCNIQEQDILRFAWRSTATHIIYANHRKGGLDASFQALKTPPETLSQESLLTSTPLTEESFANFSGESIKAIRSQRLETKKSINSKLTSKNIRGIK